MYFALIFGLIAFGIFLVVCEVFLPGGIVGGIGVVLMIIAVWLCFEEYGFTYGIVSLIACIVFTFFAAIIAFHFFPRTKTGKWVITGERLSKSRGYTSDSYFGRVQVGLEGITESELRPAGIIMIDGERFDVVSDGEFLEPHTPVKVTKVDGNRIVVTRI